MAGHSEADEADETDGTDGEPTAENSRNSSSLPPVSRAGMWVLTLPVRRVRRPAPY
jgi:hypothetical protein